MKSKRIYESFSNYTNFRVDNFYSFSPSSSFCSLSSRSSLSSSPWFPSVSSVLRLPLSSFRALAGFGFDEDSLSASASFSCFRISCRLPSKPFRALLDFALVVPSFSTCSELLVVFLFLFEVVCWTVDLVL